MYRYFISWKFQFLMECAISESAITEGIFNIWGNWSDGINLEWMSLWNLFSTTESGGGSKFLKKIFRRVSENFDFEGKLYYKVPINFAGGERQQVKRVNHTEKDYIIVFPLSFKCYKYRT